MTNRTQEIRQAIIAYMKKHNRCPNFKSVGTDWHEGQPIFDAMHADGTLVYDGRKVKLSQYYLTRVEENNS